MPVIEVQHPLVKHKIGLMRDEAGQPLDGKQWQDAEDIAL